MAGQETTEGSAQTIECWSSGPFLCPQALFGGPSKGYWPWKSKLSLSVTCDNRKYDSLMVMDDEIIARVRQILDNANLTQRAASQLIGIDEIKLAKSLKGTRNLRSLELALIAKLGNRTVEWLLTGVEPRSMVFAHRSALTDRTIATEAGSIELALIAERYEGLEAIGLAPEITPAVTRPQGWSYVDGSNVLAGDAVGRIGKLISSLDTPDLIDVIEEQFDVNVVVADLPDGCDGMSYQDGPFKAIILGTSEVAARQRYTLAHELAHILWGDAEQGVIKEAMFRVDGDGDGDIVEKRANVFAASFTVPKDELLTLLNGRDPRQAFDWLTWSFGVSPTSMAWRMFNLQLIDEYTRTVLAARSSASCAASVDKLEAHLTKNHRALEMRPPFRLATAAVRAYLAGETGIGPVAQLLRVTEHEARRLVSPEQSEESQLANPES
jgi:Zn-dependent peptidase ImmA (M78 family)